jgi:hypothetical protein
VLKRLLVTISGLVLCGCPPQVAATPAAMPAPTFGTANPYTIVAIPPDGRWSLICQARSDTNHDGQIEIGWEMHGEERGDELRAYLTDPAGHETEVDNMLAVDATGRWLAIVEHGRPVLIDTRSWQRTPLVGTLPEVHITHGIAEWKFDPSGTHLLFARDGAPIVRDLATGAERRIAPSAWTARWSADGSWVELQTVDGDTNHDGFVVGPNPYSGEGSPGGRCGDKVAWHYYDLYLLGDPDAPSFDKKTNMDDLTRAEEAVENPDHVSSSLWRLSDGLTVAGIRAVDRSTVITSDGTKLAIGPATGQSQPLGDDCAIEAVYPPSQAVVVTCPITAGRDDGYTVTMWRRGQRSELYRTADKPDVFAFDLPYLQIRREQKSKVIDVRDGTVLLNGEGFLVWSDVEHYVVLHDHEEEAAIHWRDGKHATITLRGQSSGREAAGPYYFHGLDRVDLRTGAITRLPRYGVAFRTDGAILIDSTPPALEATPGAMSMGPLHWIAPP